VRRANLNTTHLFLFALVACGGTVSADHGSASPASAHSRSMRNACGASVEENRSISATPLPAPALRPPKNFSIETVAGVGGAREIAALPNGDLIVGTGGNAVYIVPDAEGSPEPAHVFATMDDDEAAGVAFAGARCEIYIATMHHVWVIPYHGERKASQVRRIADVRTGPVAPGTDGDIHTTTSVAYADGLIYAAAGSSCNATTEHGEKPCTEVDPTRAAISLMSPNGSHFVQRAKRIRNAIALAVNPKTGSLWVGGAGQDDLPFGHPYEYLDDLSIHPGDADYGWPECEENHHAYWRGYDCRKTVEPLIELPAYATIIGATFYPAGQAGAFAFPAGYWGGLFVAVHGSWHTDGSGCNAAPPRVVFVAMRGERPRKTVDWNDPTTQWTDFVTGFQNGCTSRIGRPTGISVGAKGSLFIADDDAGLVYRLRPHVDAMR
jgi:glucose/arabinose dehydrogenase